MGNTFAENAERPSCSSSCCRSPGSICCCLISLYALFARRFSIITPGMRRSESQTAKSKIEAVCGSANRYLPSRVCAEWLSNICITFTRACWLSISTSTFITWSDSVLGSGLLLVDGIKTPDCAELWRCGSNSATTISSKSSFLKGCFISSRLLCATSVFSVSLWLTNPQQITHHRDTENTEVAQRNQFQ